MSEKKSGLSPRLANLSDDKVILMEISRLGSSFDALSERVDRMDSRFDKIDDRFEKLDTKVDRLYEKHDSRITSLEKRVISLEKKMFGATAIVCVFVAGVNIVAKLF